MRDIYFSAGMVGVLCVGLVVYGIRAAILGRARHERVDRDGGSLFVGKRFMEFGYWLIGPVVAWVDRLGATPNGVTVFSILPGAAAGVAMAAGWFGLACFLATMSAFADIVDGLLARRQGVASDAGEVLDAAVDRYSEFFFLGGLLIHYRDSLPMMLLTLGAIAGGYMVSYATVKAEAMGVPAPRGSMRRSERAIYLFFGAGFTPLATILAGPDASLAVRNAPMVFALGVVAVVANVSVIRRTRVIIAAIQERERLQRAGGPATVVAPVTAVAQPASSSLLPVGTSKVSA
jgi:phosphatidylglycerophosphate synthase